MVSIQLVKIASHEDYQEGDSILQQNEKPTFLVVVLRGSVSLYREWEDAVEVRAKFKPHNCYYRFLTSSFPSGTSSARVFETKHRRFCEACIDA